ncbi:hypothetical protein D3C87_2130980 [compost metagenome]
MTETGVPSSSGGVVVISAAVGLDMSGIVTVNGATRLAKVLRTDRPAHIAI